MDRRTLLKRIALLTGVAVASPLAGSLAAALEGDPPRARNLPLTDTQRRLAGLLAEHVIPATDTPGALAAGVDDYIATLVAGYLPAHEALAYREGLAALERHAAEAEGAAFGELDPEVQRGLLEPLDRRAFAGADDALAAFWRTHKALTLAGYYTSEIGATQELRPMPMGPWEADVPYADIGRAWS